MCGLFYDRERLSEDVSGTLIYELSWLIKPMVA
jgi:hypothetical protein